MSGNLLHVNATVMCPHGGQATVLPAQSRVLVSGQPVATLADVYTIAGCAAPSSGSSPPCTTIKWITPAGRVKLNGQPALTQGSVGLCTNPAPAGAPMIVVVQQRAVGQ